MVLIISKENEASTLDIISWLDKKNTPWVRINKEDEVTVTPIADDYIFEYNNTSFKLSKIKSVWYRRGEIKTSFFSTDKDYEKLPEPLFTFLKIESRFLKDYLYFLIFQKKHLNTFSTAVINKLIATDIAESIGFKVPESYVLNSKKEFLKLKEEKGSLITKTICGNPIIRVKERKGSMYTTQVESVKEDNFFPSLFQTTIPKKYELRVFYLDGKTYSMAIFSQDNESTSIDLRNHDFDIIQRTVPFKLPGEINNKIDLLMNKLKLNSGSIDILVSPDNKYYFLEVNPVGQFGMLSYPCNYRIEEKIADYLAS
ncbi:grasp-with-spasm system ATP-grasp peptide maturase [Tenacibaculum singaporense]|uniref:Grasp-with-spasm system ATP-grasp peptide maturase n=1 Tax=Tenacibaculum singaporense TaxID=2358479 RepID=A0A3Q8RS49_9FLAO|nr:grasp-with-spasm system ATP-grasp peptide maturase [Tenacibaculum singaporense]AZJ36189.1 grasp-with-spasm system ATP-grasp peptide maturase [Tenacibaculum singaporense]